MRILRHAALAVLVGAALSGSVVTAQANGRTVFAGCVKERTDTSIALDTSGGELVTIDTTWLKPTMKDTLTSECMTVTTLMVEGRYVAESVEDGIEPNETNAEHENRSQQQEDDDDKNGGQNDD